MKASLVLALVLPGETGAPAAVYCLLLVLSLLIPVAVSVTFRQPARVWQVIALAWAVRILVMAALKAHSYSAGLEGFYSFDGDAYFYHHYGALAAADPHWLQTFRGWPPYLFLVAVIYKLVGVDLVVPQLLNLMVGVLTIPLIYELGRRVSSPAGGFTAALFWALFPSGAMWSVSMYKDVWLVLGILLCGFLIVETGRASGRDYVLAAFGFLLVAFFRPVYILVQLLTIGILNVRRVRWKGAGGRALFIVGGIAAFGAMFAAGAVSEHHFSGELTRVLSSAGYAQLVEFADDGRSSIGVLTHLPWWLRWVVQYPYAVFAPFPWQWGLLGSGFSRLAGLEMLAWYVLYFLIWRDRRRIFARPAGRALLLYAGIGFLAVSFALPNIGSIYRYRWPATALLLLLVPLRIRFGSAARQVEGAVAQRKPGDGLQVAAPSLPFSRL